MSVKGFFAVSVPVLHKIVDKSGDASDLMAYLVLAKHTSGWGKSKYMLSTAGANAVCKKTGLTYRKAQVRLEWLHKQGFINPGGAVAGVPSHVTGEAEHQREATRVRWVLGKRLGNNRAYLSHSLIEGLGTGKKHPPLIRIWDEVKVGPCNSVMDARTDALLLLIHCYAEQSIQDYGGINPEMLRGNWQETDIVPDDEVQLSWAESGLDYLIMEIEKTTSTAAHEFVNKALPHVAQDDRVERFWNAFHNLKQLGFMYEVLEVWLDNPIENPRAELFYPLYVRDFHARKTDPYCLKEVHNFLEEAGHLGGFEMHTLLTEAPAYQTFRLVKSKRDNECVIGTYRLRFRPSTEDTGRGMRQEAERAEYWQKVLKKAASSES